jgi:hypothetical protein
MGSYGGRFYQGHTTVNQADGLYQSVLRWLKSTLTTPGKTIIELIISQLLKIITRPITVENIIFLPPSVLPGLPDETISMTPPITNSRAAIVVTAAKTKLIIFCINTKKWQNWQGGSLSPPQGTKPAPWLIRGAAKEKIIMSPREYKNFFFILTF